MRPLNTFWCAVRLAVCTLLISGACLLGVACTAVPDTPPAPQRGVDQAASLPAEDVSHSDADEPKGAVARTEVTAPREAVGPNEVVLPPATRELSEAAEPEAVRITVVGDIMLGGSAAPELAKRGYEYPFAYVRSLFQDSHVVFGNLEGPLTTAGQPDPDKRYVFRSPPDKVAPALASAGFNVVSLANNHTMDYGVEGLRQTLAALDAAGIRHAGAGMSLREARQPAFIAADGHTVALLAYSLTFPETFWARRDRPGTAFGHEGYIRADVQAARERADIVVVSFHWGREITTQLRDYQPLLAHAAIDSGALVVLGHHPHVLQGIERYKDGIIFYSLGNFAFGSYSRNATRSIIAQLTIQDTRLAEVRLIPTNVNNIEVVFQPQPLYTNNASLVIEELQMLSEPLDTTIQNDNGIGTVRLFEERGEHLFSKANSKSNAK